MPFFSKVTHVEKSHIQWHAIRKDGGGVGGRGGRCSEDEGMLRSPTFLRKVWNICKVLLETQKPKAQVETQLHTAPYTKILLQIG